MTVDTRRFQLPHADRVLDGEVLARTLCTEGLIAGAHHAVPVYLRLKPATSLVVLFEVQRADGRKEPVHVVHGPGDLAAREFGKWELRARRLKSDEPQFHVDSERDVVVSRFPLDLALPRLCDAWFLPRIKRFHERLGHPLTDGVAYEVREARSQVQLLSYRPRRRCVLRWDLRVKLDTQKSERRRAIVRMRAADDGGRGRVDWRARGEFPRAPRIVAGRPGAGPFIEQDLGGVALSDPHARLDGAELGRLVADWHHWSSRQLRDDDVPTSAGEFVRRAQLAAAQLCLLVPHLEEDVTTTLDRLRRAMPERRIRRVGLHGDLHLGQVVRSQSELFLVDFDRSECGPPEADLGRMVGDLLTRRDDPVGQELVRDLLGAYQGAESRLDTPACRWFAAASLLECALEQARRFHPKLLERIPRFLALARKSLDASTEIAEAPR